MPVDDQTPDDQPTGAKADAPADNAPTGAAQPAEGATGYRSPADLPLPDNAPPTMPEEVRTAQEPPPPPGYVGQHRSDGTRKAGGIPPGTGPDVPASLGTSEAAAPAEGVHTPDTGPGGDDIDTAAPPLASRPRASRQD